MSEGLIAQEESIKSLELDEQLCSEIERRLSELNLESENESVAPIGCSEATQQVLEIIEEFPEVFSERLEKTLDFEYEIQLKDDAIVKLRPYPLNPVKLVRMKEIIGELQEHDVIEPSLSEYSSPAFWWERNREKKAVFYHPDLNEFVKSNVKKCSICLSSKPTNWRDRGELYVYISTRPPLPRSSRQNEYILIMVDDFTKYNWVVPLKKVNSAVEVRYGTILALPNTGPATDSWDDTHDREHAHKATEATDFHT
ncbi:hypothetical protein J6590_059460 [Homalodisca vitripennis]|nr:hypothetical protein J6590_059460 [Homalodisca vitripennis]